MYNPTDPGITRLFTGTGESGNGLIPVIGGTCTAWNSTTYANTVTIGSVDYTNLPVVNPAGMSTGTVLCLVTAQGPLILGRIFQP